MLTASQFEQVDWENVYECLHSLPKLFQLWAAKHVAEVEGTRHYLHYQTGECTLCPCCLTTPELPEHINYCQEEGRVKTFHAAVTDVKRWLRKQKTEPKLAATIIAYLRGRGYRTFNECSDSLPRLQRAARSQHIIGWRRMLEGMISRVFVEIQRQHIAINGYENSANKWARGLVEQLLQITHGQWIYRNVVVHHKTTGMLVTQEKEKLQLEIDRQLDFGFEDLLTEDQYLLQMNLEDLEVSNGEDHVYWLLAIKHAREACRQVQPRRGVAQSRED